VCRPLELRQPFVFYLGHLPAFTDARLSKVLQQQLTEPAHYAEMFARGIDPDLDDPAQCKLLTEGDLHCSRLAQALVLSQQTAPCSRPGINSLGVGGSIEMHV